MLLKEDDDPNLTLTSEKQSCFQSTGWERTFIEHLLFLHQSYVFHIHYVT